MYQFFLCSPYPNRHAFEDAILVLNGEHQCQCAWSSEAAIGLQPRPLRGFDEECRTFVTEQYEGKGVNLHPEFSPEKITKGEDGKLTIHLKKKSGEQLTIGDLDQVLLATGRKSNTGKLGLENVSLCTLSSPLSCGQHRLVTPPHLGDSCSMQRNNNRLVLLQSALLSSC